MTETTTMSGSPAGGGPGAAGELLTHRRVLVVIGALVLGMFLAALDQTVVSTALPTIVGDLHGASHLSWVVTAYLVSSTVSTPLWGKLGDQYGRKVFFQASIAVFLVGSVLSGLSHSMLELIAFRALQGLGGGGLMVGAQTIVGDVVSPRERGRYMGLFMGMFGITTVIGPLVGGLFVDYLSWRWIFYINIPIGAVALVVTAVALPSAGPKGRRTIDYLGTMLLSVAATALVLYTSLGGTSEPWTSPMMLGFAAVGVLGTVAFLLAERRAQEPILPLRLFRNRVFTSSSAIGFVTGFAMFGAMTFLPLFLQVVKGVSPTASGVRLFPMMGGVLVGSIGSGILVTRWGRYKVFPVVGTALMALGLYLMSLIGVATGAWLTAAYMAVFGLGLGLVMQVLVVAVQNAVPYEELGTATSGTSFFRLIGGAFGTAVFGAVFSNLLGGNLHRALGGVAIPPNAASQIDNPAILATLPPQVHAGVVQGVSTTIEQVFLIAVPVAAVAFLLSWLLPEVALRRSIRTTEAGEVLTVPTERSSLEEVRQRLERLAAHENRAALYGKLAERAEVALPPQACWLLLRVADRPGCDMVDVAGRAGVAPDRLEEAGAVLASAGLAGRAAGGALELTPAGVEVADRLVAARRWGLTELLEGWDPEAHPEIVGMVRDLARQLMADDETFLQDLTTSTARRP